MGGVSGHPNHVALARAAARLVAQRSAGPSSSSSSSVLPSGVRVWALGTTNIVRKYLGPLDLFFSLLELLWGWVVRLLGGGRRGPRARNASGSRHRTGTRQEEEEEEEEEEHDFRLCLNDNPCRTYRAILAHISQFVWYRRLFILFSRYTYLNTLRRVQVGAGPKE